MRRLLVLLALAAAAVVLAAPVADAGFTAGQCTTWAFLMRPEIVVDSMLADGSQRNWNADHWAVNARAAGFRVGTHPAVGAIAVWPAHVDGAGAVGHVAYVEQVKPDGSFYVSEENYAGDPNVHRRRVVGASSLVRFIYLQSGRPAPTAPLQSGGAVTSASLNGTYLASAAAQTDLALDVSAPTVVALKLTGPNVDRRVTWSFKSGSWTVPLDRIAGSKSLAPGTYVITVVPYSTDLTWRWLRLTLA